MTKTNNKSKSIHYSIHGLKGFIQMNKIVPYQTIYISFYFTSPNFSFLTTNILYSHDYKKFFRVCRSLNAIITIMRSNKRLANILTHKNTLLEYMIISFFVLDIIVEISFFIFLCCYSVSVSIYTVIIKPPNRK